MKVMVLLGKSSISYIKLTVLQLEAWLW